MTGALRRRDPHAASQRGGPAAPSARSSSPAAVAAELVGAAEEASALPRTLNQELRSDICLDQARKRALAADGFKRAGRDLLWRIQVDRCREVLEQALEHNPFNLNAVFMLVGCLLHAGDLIGALERAASALEYMRGENDASFQDCSLHLACATCLWRLGKGNEAILALGEAAKACRDDAHPCLALAALLDTSGQPQAAAHAADLALSRDSAGIAAGRPHDCLTSAMRGQAVQYCAGVGCAELPALDPSPSSTASDIVCVLRQPASELLPRTMPPVPHPASEHQGWRPSDAKPRPPRVWLDDSAGGQVRRFNFSQDDDEGGGETLGAAAWKQVEEFVSRHLPFTSTPADPTAGTPAAVAFGDTESSCCSCRHVSFEGS